MITGGRDGTKHVFHVAGAEPGEALALSPYRAYVHEIRPRRSRASPASQPSPAQCTVLSAVSESGRLLASGGAAPSPLVERPLSALERAECVEVFVAGVALQRTAVTSFCGSLQSVWRTGATHTRYIH